MSGQRAIYASIAASLDVLPAQAGQVLDDHAVDLAGNNVVHHLLERWTVERRR